MVDFFNFLQNKKTILVFLREKTRIDLGKTRRSILKHYSIQGRAKTIETRFSYAFLLCVNSAMGEAFQIYLIKNGGKY